MMLELYNGEYREMSEKDKEELKKLSNNIHRDYKDDSTRIKIVEENMNSIESAYNRGVEDA